MKFNRAVLRMLSSLVPQVLHDRNPKDSVSAPSLLNHEIHHIRVADAVRIEDSRIPEV